MKEKALALISTKAGHKDIHEVESKLVEGLQDVFDLEIFEIGEDFSLTMEQVIERLEEFKNLIVCGGDGTLRNVLNNLANQNKTLPKIGYIPTGTLCDGGKNLGTSHNIEKAISIIREGHFEAFDLLDVDGNVCFYMAAIGAFSDIAYGVSRNKVRRYGRLAYYWKSFLSAFEYKRINLTISINGEEKKIRTGFLLILNGRKVGGFPVNSKGCPNDGEFEVFYTKGGLFNGLARYFFHVGVHKIKTSKLEITSIDDSIWCLDGEKFEGDVKTISIRQKAVQFYCSFKK